MECVEPERRERCDCGFADGQMRGGGMRDVEDEIAAAVRIVGNEGRACRNAGYNAHQRIGHTDRGETVEQHMSERVVADRARENRPCADARRLINEDARCALTHTGPHRLTAAGYARPFRCRRTRQAVRPSSRLIPVRKSLRQTLKFFARQIFSLSRDNYVDPDAARWQPCAGQDHAHAGTGDDGETHADPDDGGIRRGGWPVASDGLQIFPESRFGPRQSFARRSRSD